MYRKRGVCNGRTEIITIDAAGTQKTIAEKIRSKRADYVLAGKGNQGTLLAELKKYFGDEELRKKVEESGGYKKTQEKARSQIEPREYYQTSDVKRLSQYKERAKKYRNGEKNAE